MCRAYALCVCCQPQLSLMPGSAVAVTQQQMVPFSAQANVEDMSDDHGNAAATPADLILQNQVRITQMAVAQANAQQVQMQLMHTAATQRHQGGRPAGGAGRGANGLGLSGGFGGAGLGWRLM